MRDGVCVRHKKELRIHRPKMRTYNLIDKKRWDGENIPLVHISPRFRVVLCTSSHNPGASE